MARWLRYMYDESWALVVFGALVFIPALAFIAIALAQTPEPANEWLLPDLPDTLHAQLCHKDFVRFWRIKDGGDWHLFNKEDAKFLKEWRGTVQWFALEGKLPK